MLYQRGLTHAVHRRRESVSETTAAADPAIEPRLTKSTTHAPASRPAAGLFASALSHSLGTADDRILWDPRIDVFEVLRAKVTGITRAMQEFHVQELCHDDRYEGSMSNHSRPWHYATSPPVASFLGHRRLHSQHSACVTLCDPADDDDDVALSCQEDRALNEDEDEDGTGGDEEEWPASPNLTALFLTTNSLIHSRFDALSETASIHSAGYDVDLPEQGWQHQFLALTTLCITHSEKLESLSAELLGTERSVRELLAGKAALRDTFHSQEKAYGDRLRDCEQVAQQQLLMISSLEELMTDIESTMENQRHDAVLHLSLVPSTSSASTCLSGGSLELDQGPWDFKKRVADMLAMDEKDDLLQRTRWEVGMCIGGGVGTGHVIHEREERWLHGIEGIFAGTGHTLPDDRDMQRIATSVSISPTLRKHLTVRGHQCASQLSPEDRKHHFVLLPQDTWVPDAAADQCQFKSGQAHAAGCSTRFTWWRRKHHCRRCGHIVCQRHGSNRLPLFATPLATPQWSRVCDGCFYTLMLA